jgi:hypothetical protein
VHSLVERVLSTRRSLDQSLTWQIDGENLVPDACHGLDGWNLEQKYVR